jgi:Tol biopolymer transport system component
MGGNGGNGAGQPDAGHDDHSDAAAGGSGGDGGAPTQPGPEPAGSLLYIASIQSPDQQNIAKFSFPERLREVFAVQDLGDAAIVYSVALSPDGTQLAVAARPADEGPTVLNLYAADGSGVPTTLLTAPDAEIREFRPLTFSPDGQWISFWAPLDPGCSACFEDYVISSAGGTPVPLLGNAGGGSCITWDPAGNARMAVVFGPGGGVGYELWTFDMDTNPNGTSLGTYFEDGTSGGCPVWGSDGAIYVRGEELNQNQLRNGNILVAADASTPGLTALPGVQLNNELGVGEIGGFALSPDGTQLAFNANAPESHVTQIYLLDLQNGGTAQALTDFTSDDTFSSYGAGVPQWLPPNGTQIAANVRIYEDFCPHDSLFLLSASGAEPPKRLLFDGVGRFKVSLDGKRLWARYNDYAALNDVLIATSDLVNEGQDASNEVVETSYVNEFFPLD